MVYCPGCGTANRDGSRFCNECGTKLPTMTSSLCPTCGTPNPPHSLYCEKCGTRLIASLAEEPEDQEPSTPSTFVPKGLSLPTKSETGAEPSIAAANEPQKPDESMPPAEEELPDWMQVVQSAVTGTSELDLAKATAASGTSEQPASEEVPGWLGEIDATAQPPETRKSQTDELLPEWAQRLRTMPEAAQPTDADEVPDWLKTLGSTGQLPSAEETPAASIPPATEEIPSWMSNLGTPAEPSAEEEELPEWLKEPTTPYFSTEPSEPAPPPVTPAKPAAEEMPDWLRDLRPAASAEESLPDWLDELGGEEHPAAESTALSSGDSALDWLSQLGANVPETSGPQAAEPSDWMSSLRAAVPEVEQPPTEEMPDWLGDTSLAAAGDEIAKEQPPKPAASQKPVTDWLAALRQATPEMEAEQAPAEEIPDWMSVVGAEETPAAPQAEEEIPDWLRESPATFESVVTQPATPSEEEGVPDWMKAVGGQEEEQPPKPLPPEKPVTDWLAALRQATPEMEAEQAPAEEIPDWMSVVGAEETPAAPQAEEEIPDWLRESPATFESVVTQPATPSEEEGIPDWMKAVGGQEQEEEQLPEPAASQKPVTDWLAALRQATPEIEAEQTPSEEIPEWMREETGAAPQAVSEPQAYEQEVPEWMREAEAAAQSPAASAEEEIPDWLRETRSTFEAAAQAAEESMPDWARGFDAAEAEQPPEPKKSATDWLAALRQATPEMEAEQAPAEVPEWQREEAEATPSALGESQSSEQEIPDWLREADAVGTPAVSQVEEEGVPDWLRSKTGATVETSQIPTTAEGEEETAVPDWLRDFGTPAAFAATAAATPHVEEPAEEGLPDWLRQEPAPTAQPELSEVPDWLREAEPAPALTFEQPPAEEAAPGETPDWLRELTPSAGAAMVPAEPEVEELEEIEQPEEAVEAEAEPESEALAAPTIGTGIAGAVKRPEKEEPAPVEVPDWLKEIRQEQEVAQQVARKAIPVPPSEVTGLTQAEIPAWLEALRPTEEVEAEKEAEAPLEVEGPLAGIANALPPAPIMGQMQGLPVKLQFVVSAEDQARAGVLRELLTQHAVAPAIVERGTAKGSVWRRRALRWVVAILLIAGIFVTKGSDLSKIVPLPKVQEMVVSPTVYNAATEVFNLSQQPTGSKVLVVFDYDATQAGELNRVAAALLRSPALGNAQIEVASLNPQGSAMAQQAAHLVVNDLDLPGFKYTEDLGFRPGQVNGVQSLLDKAKADDVKLIITLAASPETVRWWAEQMKASGLKTPLVAGVSAGAEPLTLPYLQSGQIKGMVSGLSGAMMYLKATGVMEAMYRRDSTGVTQNYQAPLDGLILSNYLMVAFIIVGVIGALLRGTGRRSA